MKLIYKSIFNKIFLKKVCEENFKNYQEDLKKYTEINNQIDKQVRVITELSNLKNKMRPCVDKVKIIVKSNAEDAEIAYQNIRRELENKLYILDNEVILEKISEVKDPIVSKDNESIVISIPYKQYELTDGYSKTDYINLCKKYDIEKKNMDDLMHKIKDIYSDLRNSEECLYDLKCLILNE